MIEHIRVAFEIAFVTAASAPAACPPSRRHVVSLTLVTGANHVLFSPLVLSRETETKQTARNNAGHVLRVRRWEVGRGTE